MFKNITNIFILLLVVSVLALGWKLNQVMVENARLDNNTQALRRQITTSAQVQRLFKSEFSRFYPKLDSIADEMGIKTRKIESVTNIYHKTVYDTVKVDVFEEVPGTSNRVLTFDAEKQCFKAEGLLDLTQTSLYPTDEDVLGMDFMLTNIEQTDTTTVIYYWSREKKKILFFNLPIGKKRYFTQSESACSESVVTESIDIVKK